MVNYSGSYVGAEEEGFREYMKHTRGLSDEFVNKQMNEKIHMDVEQDGDSLHIKLYTPSTVLLDSSATIGTPFEYTRKATGEKVKMCFKWEVDDLMHESVDSDGHKEIVHRQILPDGSIKATITSGAHKCSRTFKKCH